MHRKQDEASSPVAFITSVSFTQILGIMAVIITGIWMGKYRGGFAWDGSAHEFNYHPLCMIVSLVYLNSSAMTVYRVFRHENKFLVKLVHFALQLIAFCVAVFGLKAVFDFHNANKIPNLYSLHSWLGISTVILFTLQLVGGFASFLFPTLPDNPRASYLKLHVFFGIFIFLLAIGTCITGMTEKAFFSIPDTYSKFVPEGILINILGVILVVLAGTVMFVVINPAFKRVENTGEQIALMANDENGE